MKEEKLPFVSSSLVSSTTGEPIVPRYLIRKINGLRIGITSVVSEEPFHLLPERRIQGLQFVEPMTGLKHTLEHMRPSVDLIIVLSHLGFSRDPGLAEAFPEIDVIVGSHSQVLLNEPERIGSTVIVQAGQNAEQVGQLDLEVDGESHTIIRARVTLHPLLKDVPGDPRVAGIVAEYLSLASQNFQDTCLYSTPVPAEYAMQANSACVSCHEEHGFKWEFTLHARAFATLIREGRSTDPECTPCHTTGFCRPEGFKLNLPTPEFRNIGCVECHFVAPDHHDRPTGTAQTVQPSVCQRCHTAERSPHFDYDTYVTRVNHKESEVEDYVVREGDSLSRIALRRYANVKDWKILHEMNKDGIPDPNLIFPGQSLRLVRLIPKAQDNRY